MGSNKESRVSDGNGYMYYDRKVVESVELYRLLGVRWWVVRLELLGVVDRSGWGARIGWLFISGWQMAGGGGGLGEG